MLFLKEYIINSDNKLESVNETSYKNVIKYWEKTKERGYTVKNELNKLCLKLAYRPKTELDIEEYNKLVIDNNKLNNKYSTAKNWLFGLGCSTLVLGTLLILTN